jgi:hypothetical protein
MGFFDSIGSFFSNTAKKVVKGIKRGAGKALKGLKSAGRTIVSEVKGLKNPMAWKQGVMKAGKWLQAPAKAVEKWDKKHGLGKHMGDFSGFSPMTLATSIATAPVSGAGYLTQMTVDKKLQKKLKSGDADAIMDTAFSGLSLLPAGAIGSAGKLLGKAGKASAKAGGKVARKLGKAI